MALKSPWDPSSIFGFAQGERSGWIQAVENDREPRFPLGWEKCIDEQTGVFLRNSPTGIRAATDPPRVQVKQQQDETHRRDAEFECWRGHSTAHDTVAVNAACDAGMDWRQQKLRRPEIPTAADEKLAKWSSKKLPQLLSLKSADSPPSLELSLRLEGPHARDSSSLQPSAPAEQLPGHANLEYREVQCRTNLLGPYHHMGPFTSKSVKVKDEPVSTSVFWEDQLPVVGSSSSSTFPVSSSRNRDAGHTNTHSALEFRDLLGPRCGMGSFFSGAENVPTERMPSTLEQLAGTCTLDKVLMALGRTQCEHETGALKQRFASTRTATQTSNSPGPSSTVAKATALQRSQLLLQPPSTKISAAAAPSPASSDTSSAVSSKSSTSPSVMSFLGEELDDFGGHGSSLEVKAGSNLRSTSDPKVEDGEEVPMTLVAGGCMSCHMFVLLSKNNPSCPRCGKTGLLEISPPTKRQKKDTSPVGVLSWGHWAASPAS